jgi:hypothetical protein
MLENSGSSTEPNWQAFFEANEWIFGYGLKYRYLRILQREAHFSSTNLDGSNDVISDFLLSDTRFTKLVELKAPNTSLFENRRNRSDSWRLSTDLTDAISQILAQKANWELQAIGTMMPMAIWFVKERVTSKAFLSLGRTLRFPEANTKLRLS